MFSIVFLILFSLSLLAALYMVLREVPELAKISDEFLANQETFFGWLMRIARRVAHALDPKRIRMRLLARVVDVLNATRMFFSKIHHVVETMAKTAREKSQKMDWEHRWYPPEEVKRDEDTKTDSSRQSPA